ncbi:MAG: succinate--CoA ligase subunit beta, partial [Deltaproteobacteria bacterium]
MKLHEYQAKEVLRNSGVSVPAGELVTNARDAAAVAGRLKGPPWVVKAQVHAGGRGKAGGVRVIDRAEEVPKAVEDMIGKKLVTRQTGPRGVTIHQVLVEEGIAIDRELYLGMLVDRSCAAPTLIFSRAGGMEIEEVAAKSPELILKGSVDPAAGWMPYLARNLAYGLEPLPSPDTLRALMGTMANLYRVFMKHDCSLVEINPLVISAEGGVVALDAKMTIDDNVLFRQKDLR